MQAGDYDPDTYAKSWTRIKGQTSASPFGLRFTEVKALVQDSRLLELIYTLAWAPFAHGFVPTAWTRTTNVMLEKQLNNFNVEKLRAIALLVSFAVVVWGS